MAKSTRNEFEFMSMVLDALGVEYEEADIKQRERWRGKVLDGWGVDYVVDDLKQFARWRKKCLEGLAKNSGGGGGSGDFSTATLTVKNNTISTAYLTVPYILSLDGQGSVGAGRVVLEEGTNTVSVILYKGKTTILTSGYAVTTLGDIERLGESFYLITGDAFINLSSTENNV